MKQILGLIKFNDWRYFLILIQKNNPHSVVCFTSTIIQQIETLTSGTTPDNRRICSFLKTTLTFLPQQPIILKNKVMLIKKTLLFPYLYLFLRKKSSTIFQFFILQLIRCQRLSKKTLVVMSHKEEQINLQESQKIKALKKLFKNSR